MKILGIGIALCIVGMILIIASIECIYFYLRPYKKIAKKLQKAIEKKDKIKYYRIMDILNKNNMKALSIKGKIVIVSEVTATDMHVKFDEDIKIL